MSLACGGGPPVEAELCRSPYDASHSDSDTTDPEMPDLVPILHSASCSKASELVNEVPEKSAQELAKMSKLQRRSYHEARFLAAQEIAPPKFQPKSRAERRALQEAQRRSKKDVNDLEKNICSLLRSAGALDEDLAAEEEAVALRAGLSQDRRSYFEAAAEDEEEGAATNATADEDDELEGGEDFYECVKSWVRAANAGVGPEATSDDFTAMMRLWGHGSTPPADRLNSILHAVLEKIEGLDSLHNTPLHKRPSTVAKAVKSTLRSWFPLLNALFREVASSGGDAAEILVGAVRHSFLKPHREDADGTADFLDCTIVGTLMSFREEVDTLNDAALLTACQGIQPSSHVLRQFFEFLEKEINDSSESDDSELP
eukprot:TRINITY_DN116349_c0_g1_i1.p1 TRINITY_DN116349_c0_g1~~TRINITY_DN116349_c0_g1_i1.p1  ORF type:complete len:372 (+),score=79.11 TRINITY_DN116349_c0_g1_i1:68-1183(+)